MRHPCRAVLAALAVAALCAGSAADHAPLTVRHVTYLAVDARRGSQLTCEVACLVQGPYPDWLRCRLVRPDGLVGARTRTAPGGTASVAADVSWDGRCEIQVDSGWNLAQMRFAGDVPHAYRSMRGSPLCTVRAWGPLYFYVPHGTTFFNVWIQAATSGEGARVVIKEPAGSVVRDEEGDFDARTQVKIRVSKAQVGAAWSVEITSPQKPRLKLDDVHLELGRHLPPFLAHKREWAERFARDWRYDAHAALLPNRLDPTAPTRPPFRGAPAVAVDAAYDRDQSQGWRTTLPFAYVLDYGSEHLGNPDYIPTVAAAPPTLLHLGKDVPLNHGWGPVKALGGENQAHGQGDDVARITPQQLAERIDGLRRMVSGLHGAGARWVMPYVCAVTVNGNLNRRTGFWDFYDHWDAYLRLGLCPRPDDPANWLQRVAGGGLKFYYAYKGDHYPRFDPPNHRYAACWSAQGWRAWLGEVTRFVAKCGYDGMFVDNATCTYCQCPRCLAAFRQHLATAHTTKRQRELFGDRDVAAVTFDVERYSPLYAAVRRFSCRTAHSQMAELKRVGTRELGREFAILPNGGDPPFVQLGLCDADFVMFEKAHGTYGTHPGMISGGLFRGVSPRAYNHNVFEYKFVQCLRKRVRPVMFTLPGHPRRYAWLRLNPNAARLGMAECAAFSGGGGLVLRSYVNVYHDAINAYREFFETHPNLYAGMDSYAQIAVLACPEQEWLGHRGHMGSVRAVTDALTDRHVLFDYVSEERLTAEVMRRYDAVVATDLWYVSPAHMREILSYVRNGGRLVFTGDLGAFTDAKAPRGAGEFAQVLSLTAGRSTRLGQGSATRCEQIDEVHGALCEALARDLDTLSCPDPVLGAHAKVNAFRPVDAADARLVVHVVNYNVPLGAQAGPPIELDGVALDVPLREGERTTAAKGYAPDEAEPAALPVSMHAGWARVLLPRLTIYRVVELTLAREGGGAVRGPVGEDGRPAPVMALARRDGRGRGDGPPGLPVLLRPRPPGNGRRRAVRPGSGSHSPP